MQNQRNEPFTKSGCGSTMEFLTDGLILSSSDLIGHLSCRHFTSLNLKVAAGALAKPDHYDPRLEILRERGQRHEQAYVEHLIENGHKITTIDGAHISEDMVAATQVAMEAGQEIIIQGALSNERWRGRADVLRRVEVPSELGSHSYEIIDTKLARNTKGGTVLQLCLYAHLLETMQGIPPEHLYVVVPWSNFEPQRFRYSDYAAYFRRVKKATELATLAEQLTATYPDPNDFCDVCRWRMQCDNRRRNDDHLCLVAGITKTQILELQAHGIGTTQALAEMPLPLPFKPKRGTLHSFENAREQAAVQVDGRISGECKYVLLDIVPEFGLAAMPEPSAGDVFFDIEGNPFVGEHGMEYLFGYVFTDSHGKSQYVENWAFDRYREKLIFERFIDVVADRRKEFPDMHVYHFGSYEPGALKRLMGRYATREESVDNLLRGLVFVDLLRVTRHALRASVESYSLKDLEPFFNFNRATSLRDANIALTKISAGLELDDVPTIDSETKKTVASYNCDDCLAAAALRKWLEEIRGSLVEMGQSIPRPGLGQDGPGEVLNERQEQIQALIECLVKDVPIDPEERSEVQQAQWILAYILDWHRRENKAVWWEYFRLKDLNAEELLEERSAIGRLQYETTVARSTTGIPTDRYKFEVQETDLRGNEDIYSVGGDKIGKAIALSPNERTIDIKKFRASADTHPEAIYAHTFISTKEQAESLLRLGKYVAEYGVRGDGEYKAGRDLLIRTSMDTNGQAFQKTGEKPLEAALRLTKLLKDGVLPIQGPPGSGKSFTGARMICELVKQGKTVGITANSHKVIRNLIDKAIAAAPEYEVDLVCVQKPGSEHDEDATKCLSFAGSNGDLIGAIRQRRANVAGATSFFWARGDAKDLVDILVVDEAGQMSLANVLAVSQAARALILLGDPQQLEQPTQGAHPDGTDVSALDHLLAGRQTIDTEEGLFLSTTFRLHPDICTFNSELFYEGKLKSIAGCEKQVIVAGGSISGSGLRYFPVAHEGNTSSSIEEALAVKGIYDHILESSSHWIDRKGIERVVEEDDILIISPYNAQVFEIRQRLPNARVGTVDKFQGQEAPIAIFSMATSSYADAPRGMEFLYSANRFNVAISRAKCMAILVASPQIFEADCRTPQQMKLANAFCRFLEISSQFKLQ